MEENSKHATVDRREKILSILSSQGKVYVQELSKQFNVSEVTIRNDLDQLESKRQLIRARGGAMKLEGNVAADIILSDKNKLNYKEKARIGAKAASLITDSDTIILDSGTTTSEIARNIGNINNLSIITNAINIVNVLSQHPLVNIIIPGGHLRKNSLSLVGPLAEKNLRNFYVDKAFIGVDGFDAQSGAYTPNIEEAHLNEIMISIAKEVIIVADSSKFKRKSLAFICTLDKINTIITDDGISPEDYKRLTEKNIKVIIA